MTAAQALLNCKKPYSSQLPIPEQRQQMKIGFLRVENKTHIRNREWFNDVPLRVPYRSVRLDLYIRLDYMWKTKIA